MLIRGSRGLIVRDLVLLPEGYGLESRVRQEMSVCGGGITSALFHPQYHDWGETLEQGTEPPTAPQAQQQYYCPLLRVCVHSVCVHCCVCVCDWMVKCRVRIPGIPRLH